MSVLAGLNNFRGKTLLPVSVLLLMGIWYYFISAERSVVKVQNVVQEDAPQIIVREDTLTSLLKNFFTIRNIGNHSSIQPKDDQYEITMARFGNNPMEFFNNNRLDSVTGKSFSVEVTPTGINARFRRLQQSGISYVEVPSDIFFRLITNKLTHAR